MKTYHIEFTPIYWECTIRIDEEKARQPIREMVEFWHGWESHLDDNDGDYTKTFIQQISRTILYMVAGRNLNINGVRNEFNNLEGWCKMDGTHGIEILSVDEVEFHYDDFEIEEE